MSIKKKDLLNDIQEKIDICNKHLSTNPYEPAQRRVGYILNNKCKASNIPFYLNAIYNQQQLRLNTDIEKRRELLYNVTKEFTLADIQNMSIDIVLIDSITVQKQKKIDAHYQTEKYVSGIKGGKEQWKQRKVYKQEKWVSLVNNQKERYNETYAEVSKTKHFNSLGEAVQFYKTIKEKIKTEEIIEPEFEEKETVFRYIKTHKYEAHAYFNFNEYINKLVSETRNEEEGVKGTEGQPLLNFEYCGHKFFDEYDNEIENVSDEDKRVQITWEINKLTKKKVDTYVYDPVLDELNVELDKLYKEEWKEVFDDYEETYKEYVELYNKNKKKINSKVEEKFNTLIDKLDKLFSLIKRYQSQMTDPTLLDWINEYDNYKNSINLYRREEPVQRAEVKKIADVETTDSYKMLLSRQAEMQQVLNTGNNKLKEYYENEINKYSQQTEQYKKKVQQNKKDIEDYKKYLEQFKIDVQEYQNGFKIFYAPGTSDFRQVYIPFINFIAQLKEQKIKQVAQQQKIYDSAKAAKLKEYEESTNFFKANDIKYKVIISFMPDGIPYYAIM